MIIEFPYDYFIEELREALGDELSVSKVDNAPPAIPLHSQYKCISDIVSSCKELRRKHSSFTLSLVDSDLEESTEFIQITKGDLDSQRMHRSKLTLLQNLSRSNLIKNVSFGNQISDVKGHYFKLNNHLQTAHPSFGSVKLRHISDTRKKLILCTPVYKRFKVLDVWLKYMSCYLMPELEQRGYSTTLAISGGAEEFETVKPYTLFGNIVYLEHPNNLGDKKNLLLRFAKEGDFDYLSYIDSDDLLSSKTIDRLIKRADKNSFWSSVEGCCFLDIPTMRMGIFEGYSKEKKLHGWGLGSGRIFTKRLQSAIDEDPFARKNKSMDWHVRVQLSVFNIAKEDRLLSYAEDADLDLPIGLKCGENIWGYDGYKPKPIDQNHPQVSWLPRPILAQIESLQGEV